MNDRNESRLAVALCDIEPATFEHVALIREWLLDLGVDRVTTWLAERRRMGDAVARQGFDEGCAAGGAWSGLSRTFDWWVAAGAVRAGSIRSGNTIRVEVHPQDFDAHPGRTRALERTLRSAAARCRPVTYDDLAVPPLASEVGRVVGIS